MVSNGSNLTLIKYLLFFHYRQEGNLKNETTENDQNIIELYKRWWQLNTFLPIVHFIRPPMSFPKNQVSIFFLKKVFRPKLSSLIFLD